MAHLGDLLAGVDGLVGAYDALPGEVDLSTLLPDAGRVVLPRIDGDVVTWHRDDGRREPHRFGMGQPPADAVRVDPEDLAVLLVPGRSFDRRGFRLGRGGGHYDRLLPRLRRGTPAVGVAVDARIVPRLRVEPHDVPMTHLATESGVRAVR